jgi:hypothetical protein
MCDSSAPPPTSFPTNPPTDRTKVDNEPKRNIQVQVKHHSKRNAARSNAGKIPRKGEVDASLQPKPKIIEHTDAKGRGFNTYSYNGIGVTIPNGIDPHALDPDIPEGYEVSTPTPAPAPSERLVPADASEMGFVSHWKEWGTKFRSPTSAPYRPKRLPLWGSEEHAQSKPAGSGDGDIYGDGAPPAADPYKPTQKEHTYSYQGADGLITVTVPEGMDPHLMDPRYPEKQHAPTQRPTVQPVVVTEASASPAVTAWENHWKQWGKDMHGKQKTNLRGNPRRGK